MKKTIPVLGVALAVILSLEPVQAQGVTLAPHAGYNVDFEELLFGASVGIPINAGATQLRLSPGFEFYPGLEGGSVTSFMVDVHYSIPVQNASVDPYIGGGLAIHRTSVDLGIGGSVGSTDSQINALGGLAFGSGPFKPFVEAGYRFANGSALVLKGGGRIGLGGSR